MASFGDKLKREREMRGVTLDEISESTKIARRHLEALEADDFQSLPGGVFNKGFVKAYAHFIGINEEQAVADYSSAHKEEAPPEDHFPLEIHEKPDRKMNPRTSHLPLFGAVIALVLLVAGYAVWHSRHQAEGVQPVAASGPETPASPQPANTAVSQPASVQANVVAVDQKVPSPETTKSVAVTAPPKTEDPVRTTKPAPPERTFFVVIKAKEDSWISVTADGRTVSHGILKADKQKFVRAGKQILITTGNAGGLDVSYNGKPVGVIGNESEARTLLFTPTGVAQQ
jgi:cytoskeleton protein RodZ